MRNRNQIIDYYLQNQAVHFCKKELFPILDKINISVIIPIYDEENIIPSLITSFKNQIYKNFEVIVVDNGSKDKSLKIINHYINKVNYPLYVLSEKKPGPGNARKKGMDWVLSRLCKDHRNKYLKHILVSTDADVISPKNWLKKISANFNKVTSGAQAGTHGAADKIDELIEDKIGVKNYFNKIPLIIEFLAKNKIGRIKMSGPNSAFEIEAYAAAGGIEQPFDNVNKRIALKEIPQLCEKVRLKGYPIIPMGVRVITSRRRHLLELINGENMYFPSSHKDKTRFYSVRDNEIDLLKLAFKKVPKIEWINYQKNTTKTVLNNIIFHPAIKNEIKTSSLSKLLNKLYLFKFERELIELNKNSTNSINMFEQKWSEIFEYIISNKIT